MGDVLTFFVSISYDKGARGKSFQKASWGYGTTFASYTFDWRRCCTLKHKDFIYIGEPIPELNEAEHAAFFLNLQKSILLSLNEKKLLTTSQYEKCVSELEYGNSERQKKQRRAWSLALFYIHKIILMKGMIEWISTSTSTKNANLSRLKSE